MYDTKAEAQKEWRAKTDAIFHGDEAFVAAEAEEYGIVTITVTTEDEDSATHSYIPWACSCSKCVRQYRDEGADEYLAYIGGACGARELDWERRDENGEAGVRTQGGT